MKVKMERSEEEREAGRKMKTNRRCVRRKVGQKEEEERRMID